MNVGHLAVKAYQSGMSRMLAGHWKKTHPNQRVGRGEPNLAAIDRLLAESGARVEHYRAAPERYARWVRDARYPWDAYLVNKPEKYLEHQISFDFLPSPESGIVIDVASCRSYFPTILSRRGYRVIAQDLSYAPGLNGDKLGGSAASMDFPAHTVAGMTLHCSFEHFEGTSDSDFVRECARLLRPGGRAFIVPLYLHHEFLIESDPFVARDVLTPDPGSQLIASFGYANRHGRHYDLTALERRVLRPAVETGLIPTVIRIENVRAIHPSCYANYALSLEKPQ